MDIRVRTTLALGYWVLANICWYWVVLLLGVGWHFFFIVTPNMIPIRQQSAVSSQHHPHDNYLDICDVAVVRGRWQGEWGGDRVQAIHHHHHHRVLKFYMI